MARETPGERGFALLVVLWTLVLLSLLITQLTLSGRGEAQLAGNLRLAATVQAAADAGIQAAIFHALDSSAAHWPADGRPRRIELPGAAVDIRIESQAGRINPNTASPELLAALLHAVGADVRTAAALAADIVAWRFPGSQAGPTGSAAARYRAAGRDFTAPGTPFQSIGELGLVLGMTPALLAGAAPYLSLYRDGDPDLALAAAPVARAMAETYGAARAGGGGDESVIGITSSAGAGGSRFVRRAVVRVGTQGNGSPYRILTWETGE
jgi:general secretion pathway protein K